MARLGTAHWPGVEGVISCQYTASHGITPGVATLEIREQDVRTIKGVGNLTITDGVNEVILQRCRVDSVDYNSSDGGRTMVLHILDRRWMWRYGNVRGNWNQLDPYPDPDLFPPGEYVAPGGPYMPGTYRPVAALMLDCLAEMNEIAPLVAPTPDAVVPFRWDNEVPAQALQQCCDAVGYRVCYRTSENRVLVAPAGHGKNLPEEIPYIDSHPAIDFPERPAAVWVQGGASLFADYLELEPVGFERNGAIKPIDKLSYKPAAGWANCNPQTMDQVAAGTQMSRGEAIEWAKKCVWRTFRVKLVDVATRAAPGPNVAGFGLVADRKQIVLHPQIYFGSKDITGQPETQPAFAVGSVYVANNTWGIDAAVELDATGRNTSGLDGTRLPWAPAVDGARGIVTFPRQMYRVLTSLAETPTRIGPPTLFLYTSFNVRTTIGLNPVCFAWGGALPGEPNLLCPGEFLRRPDLVAVHRAIRKDRDKTLATLDSNTADLIGPANHAIAAAVAKYAVTGANTRTYAGIWPIQLDGAVAQVGWSVGRGPATTTASVNTEHDPYVRPLPERRRNEQFQSYRGQMEQAAAAASAPPQTRVSQNDQWAPPPGFTDPP